MSHIRHIQWMDPLALRFSHGDIHDRFSGTGKTLDETIELVLAKQIRPDDFPPLLVVTRPGRWPVVVNGNRRLYVFRVARARGKVSACSCKVVGDDHHKFKEKLDEASSSTNGGVRVFVRGAASRFSDQQGISYEPCCVNERLLEQLCVRLAERMGGFDRAAGTLWAAALSEEGYRTPDECCELGDGAHPELTARDVPERFLAALRCELSQPLATGRRPPPSPQRAVRRLLPTVAAPPVSELCEEDGDVLVVQTELGKARALGSAWWFRRRPPGWKSRSKPEWMPVDSDERPAALLHPKVQAWMQGEPLALHARFHRGLAGRTPTVIQRGLSERSTGEVAVLEVVYAEWGRLSYRRGAESRMPEESSAGAEDWRSMGWLEMRGTYKSPALGQPVPNRVAEWLEGRSLSPRQSLRPPPPAMPQAVD